MAETEEREEGAAAGGRDAAREVEAAGEVDAAREAAGSGEDAEEGELRAEEESAKAMEAEVPHPPGYSNPGQESPS